MKRFLRITDYGELTRADTGGFDGIYFGSEFCAARLPSTSETQAARKFCRDRNLLFIAVTPITRERDFGCVMTWLAQSTGGEGECVANDLGILERVAADLPGLVPHAGRMLSRQQRGPRMAGLINEAGEEEAAALMGSLWDEQDYLKDLQNLGVRGVELDAVPWGMGAPLLPEGMELAVHAPYAVVTWSPVCFFGPGFLGQCGRECVSSSAVRMENGEDPTPLWMKGNAVFMRLEDEDAVRAAEAAKPDRLVWSPFIPG